MMLEPCAPILHKYLRLVAITREIWELPTSIFETETDLLVCLIYVVGHHLHLFGHGIL